MKEIEYYDLDWRDDVAYEFDSKSPFTGIVVNYYTETEKKLKEKFTNKNGEKDGSYESYHENGSLNFKGNYSKGVLEDGSYEKYYENGQIWIEGTYQKGELHGPFKKFYENGQLWEEGKFKEGKKEGLHIRYHENGQIYDQRNYLNGELL